MTHEVVRILPMSAAKVFALVYLILGAVFAAFAFLKDIFTYEPAPYAGLWFFAPFLYAVVGFVFTYIAAFVYNIVAKRFGGIQFETVEISKAQQDTPGGSPHLRARSAPDHQH